MSRTALSLIRLMARERALLLAGDLAGAGALAARKADLAGRLADGRAEPGPLARVQAEATRNMALLEAAREGALAAQATIGAIAGGVTTRTYSAAGQRTAIGAEPRRLERRA